jgi:heme exporter protein D
MCISAGMALALATGVQVVGSVMQGQQTKRLHEQRAREAELQAAQLRLEANVEREAAGGTADKIRKAGKQTRSQAKASLAKSGVAADAGSAVTIQDYISRSAEEDALAEILEGENRARRLETGAGTAVRESGYERAAGRNAQVSGFLGAGSSLLSAGYEWKRTGRKMP